MLTKTRLTKFMLKSLGTYTRPHLLYVFAPLRLCVEPFSKSFAYLRSRYRFLLTFQAEPRRRKRFSLTWQSLPGAAPAHRCHYIDPRLSCDEP